MAAILFEHLDKVYPDGTQAIFDLSLEIADREFMVFVGPSGCGKSTALRMVAGLEEITAGNILIDGKVINHLSPKNRDLAMVFQSYALYPHMSVEQNMGFSLKLAKVPKDEIKTRVVETANMLGLEDLLHRKPKALSGGQRQRVAMGRAIVRSPRAYLMDEPLSNLDAKLRVQMRGEISALQDRLGVTMLYVTHDQVEAMTMGDRVAVMMRGVLQQVATPIDLYQDPANLFVAGFIGSPAMNLSVVTIIQTDNGLAFEFQPGSRIRIADQALDRYPRVAQYVGREVAVGIRPEHLVPATEVSEDERILGIRVALVESLGAETLVYLDSGATVVVSEDIKAAIDDDEAFERLKQQDAGGQRLVMRVAPSEAPKVGATMDIGVKPGGIHFFDIDSGHALK